MNLSCSSTIESKKFRQPNCMTVVPEFTTNSKMQRGAGRRAFSASCKQTYSYAAEAAQFGAVWAETSIPQFLHAYETAKHLGDALQKDRRGKTVWLSLTNYSCRNQHRDKQHHSHTVSTKTEGVHKG